MRNGQVHQTTEMTPIVVVSEIPEPFVSSSPIGVSNIYTYSKSGADIYSLIQKVGK